MNGKTRPKKISKKSLFSTNASACPQPNDRESQILSLFDTIVKELRKIEIFEYQSSPKFLKKFGKRLIQCSNTISRVSSYSETAVYLTYEHSQMISEDRRSKELNFKLPEYAEKIIYSLESELKAWKGSIDQENFRESVGKNLEIYTNCALEKPSLKEETQDLIDFSNTWNSKYCENSEEIWMSESTEQCQKCKLFQSELDLLETTYIDESSRMIEETNKLKDRNNELNRQIESLQNVLTNGFPLLEAYHDHLNKIRTDVENLFDCELPTIDSEPGTLTNFWLAIRKAIGEFRKKTRIKTKNNESYTFFRCPADDLLIFKGQLESIVEKHPIKARLGDHFVTIVPTTSHLAPVPVNLELEELEEIVRQTQQGLKDSNDVYFEDSIQKCYKTLYEESRTSEESLKTQLKTYKEKSEKAKKSLDNIKHLLDQPYDHPKPSYHNKRKHRCLSQTKYPDEESKKDEKRDQPETLESLAYNLKKKEQELKNSSNTGQILRDIVSINSKISKMKTEMALRKSMVLSTKINKSLYLIEQNSIKQDHNEMVKKKKTFSMSLKRQSFSPVKSRNNLIEMRLKSYNNAKNDEEIRNRQYAANQMSLITSKERNHERTDSLSDIKASYMKGSYNCFPKPSASASNFIDLPEIKSFEDVEFCSVDGINNKSFADSSFSVDKERFHFSDFIIDSIKKEVGNLEENLN